MTAETARRVLQSLLAERGVAIPEAAKEDGEAGIRQLVRCALSPEVSGTLPDTTAKALAEIFDAVSGTAKNTDSGKQ